VTFRLASYEWAANGLDNLAALQPLHDAGMTALAVAPLVLALCGFGRLRDAAVFLAFALAGAAISAPFAIARVAGA
jgi:hypothetical protein